MKRVFFCFFIFPNVFYSYENNDLLNFNDVGIINYKFDNEEGFFVNGYTDNIDINSIKIDFLSFMLKNEQNVLFINRKNGKNFFSLGFNKKKCYQKASDGLPGAHKDKVFKLGSYDIRFKKFNEEAFKKAVEQALIINFEKSDSIEFSLKSRQLDRAFYDSDMFSHLSFYRRSNFFATKKFKLPEKQILKLANKF
jgi:hypothetical protein